MEENCGRGAGQGELMTQRRDASAGMPKRKTRLNLRRPLAFGDDDFVAVAQRNVRRVLEAYRNKVIAPFFL